jgi:hypothetical protein
VQVYLVEREEQAAPAMAALRRSMADSVVAIDLVRLPSAEAPAPTLACNGAHFRAPSGLITAVCVPTGQDMCLLQEWRPDRGQGKVSRVALVQLASSSVCVLLRTCLLGWQLPPCVQAFLR